MNISEYFHIKNQHTIHFVTSLKSPSAIKHSMAETISS